MVKVIIIEVIVIIIEVIVIILEVIVIRIYFKSYPLKLASQDLSS